MGRSLLVVGLGILLGCLIAWVVLGSVPPPPADRPSVVGFRPPQ